jgi:hypothetical protein
VDKLVKKKDVTILSDADSCPIIISDGSTRIRHAKNRDHFSDNHPDHDEQIYAVHYGPIGFGYHCDPSNIPPNGASPCPNTLCPTAGVPTAPCRISTTGASTWELSLCESRGRCAAPGIVHISWNKSAAEKMEIHSNNRPLTYDRPNGGMGAKISDGSGPPTLQSALLAVSDVNGHTAFYPFDCTGDCLIIAYDCKNGQCKDPSQ